MATRSADARIEKLVGKTAGDARAGEVLWRMRADDGRVDLTYGDPDRPFSLASATKLFVTTILAQLRDEGRIDWDAPLAGYLPALDLTGIVVVRGADRSGLMTVRAVMAHTSGLADYFEGQRPDGPSTFARVLQQDFAWDVNDVLGWTRELAPATPGRGHYSDTGYQLLGAAIEAIDGRSFAEAVQARIAEPLGLTGTYCFGLDSLDRYDDIAAIRVGRATPRIPLALASVQADGGIVSTLADGLAFMDGFFGGELFPAALLAEMQVDWHRVFFPLEYGTGIMRLRMPAVMTGMRRLPPLVGHSGASGVVMYRCHEKGLTVVGTVNQAENRSMPYQLMVRTAVAAL